MRGHQPIIAMRRAGYTPDVVWVSDFDFVKPGDATVCVAGDTPELEDFRFLVGLTAIVDGHDAKRVERIAAACKRHAKRVIASVARPVDQWRWEVVSVHDSEGVMTWPV